MLERGDHEGQPVRLRIRRAIAQFQAVPEPNRISRLSPRQVQLEICSLPGECGFLTVLERDLRDLDRLVAVLALVLRRVFRALLFGLAFLTVAFLALVRVRVVLLA